MLPRIFFLNHNEISTFQKAQDFQARLIQKIGESLLSGRLQTLQEIAVSIVLTWLRENFLSGGKQAQGQHFPLCNKSSLQSALVTGSTVSGNHK